MSELGLRRKIGGCGAVLGLVSVASQRQQRVKLMAFFGLSGVDLGSFSIAKGLDLASLALAVR